MARLVRGAGRTLGSVVVDNTTEYWTIGPFPAGMVIGEISGDVSVSVNSLVHVAFGLTGSVQANAEVLAAAQGLIDRGEGEIQNKSSAGWLIGAYRVHGFRLPMMRVVPEGARYIVCGVYHLGATGQALVNLGVWSAYSAVEVIEAAVPAGAAGF